MDPVEAGRNLLRIRGLVAREMGRWPSEVDATSSADVFGVQESLVEYPSMMFTSKTDARGEGD